jgi:hypothetical protein
VARSIGVQVREKNRGNRAFADDESAYERAIPGGRKDSPEIREIREFSGSPKKCENRENRGYKIADFIGVSRFLGGKNRENFHPAARSARLQASDKNRGNRATADDGSTCEPAISEGRKDNKRFMWNPRNPRIFGILKKVRKSREPRIQNRRVKMGSRDFLGTKMGQFFSAWPDPLAPRHKKKSP